MEQHSFSSTEAFAARIKAYETDQDSHERKSSARLAVAQFVWGCVNLEDLREFSREHQIDAQTFVELGAAEEASESGKLFSSRGCTRREESGPTRTAFCPSKKPNTEMKKTNTQKCIAAHGPAVTTNGFCARGSVRPNTRLAVVL